MFEYIATLLVILLLLSVVCESQRWLLRRLTSCICCDVAVSADWHHYACNLLSVLREERNGKCILISALLVIVLMGLTGDC